MSMHVDTDHFATYNATAPIEVSCGNHKVYRLSRRGNRRVPNQNLSGLPLRTASG